METYQGTCRFCGNIQSTPAEDRFDADEKISRTCECGGFHQEQRRGAAKKNIEELFGEKAQENGWTQVEAEQLELIRRAAELVLADKAENITIGFGDGKAKICQTSSGAARIERTKSCKIGREI